MDSFPFPFLDQFFDAGLELQPLEVGMGNQFNDLFGDVDFSVAEALDHLGPGPTEEKEKIDDIEGEIRDQNGAQNGPDQIEIKKGASIQISLNEKMSGWIGTAVFHTSPKYRQDTIASPDGLCPFSLEGPGEVLRLGRREIDGAGPAFVQTVELKNQDRLDISFNVISSDPCSKYTIIIRLRCHTQIM